MEVPIPPKVTYMMAPEKEGRLYRLVPETKKGKEILKRAGTDEWVSIKVWDEVAFNKNVPGPWLFLEPVYYDRPDALEDIIKQNRKVDRLTRWVNRHHDDNFIVTRLL